MEEPPVRSLGREDPLEEGVATQVLPGEARGQRSLAGHSRRASESGAADAFHQARRREVGGVGTAFCRAVAPSRSRLAERAPARCTAHTFCSFSSPPPEGASQQTPVLPPLKSL